MDQRSHLARYRERRSLAIGLVSLYLGEPSAELRFALDEAVFGQRILPLRECEKTIENARDGISVDSGSHRLQHPRYRLRTRLPISRSCG